MMRNGEACCVLSAYDKLGASSYARYLLAFNLLMTGQIVESRQQSIQLSDCGGGSVPPMPPVMPT